MSKIMVGVAQGIRNRQLVFWPNESNAIKQQSKDDIKDLDSRLVIAAMSTANSFRASSNKANSRQPLSNLFS